jgi:hypothetical protein
MDVVGTSSSNAMVIELPSNRWISIDRSGVMRCLDPSRCDRNATPSSLRVVSSDRLIT